MRFLPVFCAAGLLSACLSVHAMPITYTETATASGTLNGMSFTNALITFTGTGDTMNVGTYLGPDVYIRVPITLSVAGLGSTMLNGNDIFFAGGGSIGVYSPRNAASVLTLYNSDAASYDLRTYVSPIFGSPYAESVPGENFTLTSASNPSFEATPPLTPPTATTPEPSSLALLGTGVLGVLGAVRKRFA